MKENKLTVGFLEGDPVGLDPKEPVTTNSLMHIGRLGRGMGAHWEYREDGSAVIHWHSGESMMVPAGENSGRYAVGHLLSGSQVRKEGSS